MVRLAVLFLVGAVLPAHAQPAAPADTSRIIERVIGDFIRPGYTRLHEHAAALSRQLPTLCNNPSKANLEAARASFRSAADAWAAIELVRFGPVTEDNRLERLLYWPDRNGIGLKQVQAIIANRDETAISAETLAQKSVAAQGLGALEFVLFGTGSENLSEPDDLFRCRYGAAIAGNIEHVALAVATGWKQPDGFAAIWANPGADNPLYRTDTESFSELVEVFVDGLELIRDVRIKAFLGITPSTDKPRLALYWRSEGTARSLGANMAGLGDLFAVSRLEQALPADQRWIGESIRVTLHNAEPAARAAEGPIDAVLADADKRASLEHLVVITSSLSNLFGVRLSGAFGLSAGFSSLDGD